MTSYDLDITISPKRKAAKFVIDIKSETLIVFVQNLLSLFAKTQKSHATISGTSMKCQLRVNECNALIHVERKVGGLLK